LRCTVSAAVSGDYTKALPIGKSAIVVPRALVLSYEGSRYGI